MEELERRTKEDALSSTLEVADETTNFRRPVLVRLEVATPDGEYAVSEEGTVEGGAFEAVGGEEKGSREEKDEKVSTRLR